MKKNEDMSNTFIADVGQKSAIYKEDEENLDTIEKSSFPDVEVEPPKEMPTVLDNKKEKDSVTKKEETQDDDDDDFLETRKKKKNSRKNPFVTVLLIIVCLALGAGASYYYFEVYNEKEMSKVEKKETENKTTGEKKEEIKPSSTFVKDLISRYDIYESDWLTYEILYASGKVASNDLDDNYKGYVVAQAAKKKIFSGDSITKENFELANKELFGNDMLENKDVIYPSKSANMIVYKYNSENLFYTHTDIHEHANVGSNQYFVLRKIVKAEKSSSQLTVNVAVALTDGNKMYKNYDSNTESLSDEVTDIVYAGFDIEKDYGKFNQYQYTFDYDSDSYYLRSVELIGK